jgi:ComF family protein
MQWIIDLFLLFFPSNCLVCGKRLSSPRAVLCFECECKLPKTGFSDQRDNPVSKIFWGRVPVISGTSLFRFEKGSPYQTLLHDLKYRGNRKLGFYLGRLLGQDLKQTDFSLCDLIIPVPIHRKRLKKRGYNQSELIARGVSEITGIPVVNNLIVRKERGKSQTTKNRQERFENISEAFHLCDHPGDFRGKKVLIIDDVVTTGATLEACSSLLIQNFKCLVYIATVSCA